MQLPVRLIEGRIGRLQIRVPWSRLRSEPVVIECDDLLLRVRLRDDEPDATAHQHREQLLKRMRLDAEELLRGLRADAGLAHPTTRTADSFLSRLGATLLDNLRVHLVRLHVRCEHRAGERCFAFGGTLRRFELCSTDADWQPQYQRAAARQPWLHKALALEGASLYWDGAAGAETATEATREAMLPPTDASVLLRVSRASGPEGSQEPRSSWSCVLEPLEFRLTDRQYQAMLQLAADATRHALRERYSSHRPPPDRAAAGASLQWCFAADCVLSDLREQRRWHPWREVRPFLEQRREYVVLWRAYLQGTPPAPADRQRLLDLEQQLRLQDILLFRGLAARGVSRPSAAGGSARARAPAAARTMGRSASMGQLLAHQDDRPLGEAASTSESQLDSPRPGRHILPDHALDDAHAEPGDGERTGGWLAWLWRSPHQPAAGADAPESQAGPAAAGEDAGGYAPLRFTRAQTQYLQRWLHPEVEDTEARGVPSTPMVDVQGRLRIRGLRVELRCVPAEADREAVPIAVAQLVGLSLVSTQELTGRTKAEFSVQSFDVCDASGPSGSSSAELLAPREAGPAPVLHVLQEAWPASSGTWLEGGSWNPQSEAGSRISISIAPCRISLQPSWMRLVRFFCDPSAPASTPSAPASTDSTAVKILVRGPMVVLPFQGPGGSSHSLALCFASIEFEEDPTGHVAHTPAGQTSSQAAGSRPLLPALVLDRRLFVDGMALRFLADSGDAVDFMQPHSFTATFSERIMDGVAHNTVDAQLAEISIVLGKAQLDRIACLADGLAKDRDAGVFDVSTQSSLPAQRVGPTFQMDGMFGATLLRLQLSNEHHSLVLEAQQPRLTASFGTGHWQMQSDLEAFRATLRRLLPGGSDLQVLGHLLVRELSVQHDSEGTASTELTRAQMSSAELQVAPTSVHGVRGAPVLHLPPPASPATSSHARVAAAAVTLSATETSSAAVSFWFKHEPSLQDVALSLELCEIHVQEAGPVCTAIAAVEGLQSSVTTWWSALLSSFPLAPDSDAATSPHAIPLALRCDGRALALEFPSLTPVTFMDAAGISLSMLSDGAGSVDGELELEAVALLKAADPLPPLLSPLSLVCQSAAQTPRLAAALLLTPLGHASAQVVKWARRGDVEGVGVKLKAGAVQVAYLQPHVLVASAAQQLVSTLTPESAPSSEEAAGPTASLVEVVLPSAAITFAVSSEDGQNVASPDWTHAHQQRVILAIEDLHARVSAQSSGEQSMSFRFQSIALSQSTRAPQCESTDETLLHLRGRDAGPPTLLLDIEMLRTGMLVQIAAPCFRVDLGASIATRATWAALQHFCRWVPPPPPSDVPFVMDIQVEDFNVVIKDQPTSGTPSVRLRSALWYRFACSGGVSEPFRQQQWVQLPTFLIELLLDGGLPPAVMLAPCSAVLRVRQGSRGRTALQSSDLQVRVSYTQLRAVSALAASWTSLLSQPDEMGAAPAPTSAGPVVLPLSPSRPPMSSASSEVSEASEYFDAQEHLDGEAEHAAMADEPTPAPGPALESRFEAYVGTCTATFIDDCARAATPLFQLVLAPTTCEGGSFAEAVRLHAVLGLSVYHYSRRHHPAGPHGWEPVLEPCTCSVDLGLGAAHRSVEVASHGGVELNMLPSMLGSLSSLHHRLVADAAAATSNSNLHAAPDPFAPCLLLRNDTGVPLCFWLQAGHQPSELAPNAEALLPDDPGSNPRGVVHVLFEGFQRLDLRAPYRDRYRLWPAAPSGQSPNIVYVLVHSHGVEGTVHVTLHSPFALLNTTAESIGVRLRKRDSDASLSMLLKPGSREPVPIGYQCGWLEADHSPCGACSSERQAGVQDPTPQLELTVASLQTLRGRGGVMQLRSQHDPRCCYSLLAELPQQAPQSWLISVHAPFVLHNSLLCGLECELSDCASSHDLELLTSSALQRGHLERSSSLPIFCSGAWSGQGPTECYLRLRCEGFMWSKPVLLNLARGSDDGVETRTELEIRCPAARAAKPALPNDIAVVEHDRDAAVSVLRLHVVRRATGVVAEACGCVWVQNECHLPLHYVLNNDAATAAVLPPTATVKTQKTLTATPLQGAGFGLGAGLPGMRLRVAGTGAASEGGRAGKRVVGSGAFLSLSDLLHLGDQSEEIRIGPGASQQVSGGPLQEPRWLDLGAKLVPLEHKFGRSLLLTVAPRYVLLNRTTRPLQFRQQGRSVYVEVAPFAAERRLVPLHWHDAQRPRHLCFRRPERGEEWSGRIPIESHGTGPLAGGAELSIRLRNLETGLSEFPRLSLHQLPGRPTFVLQVLDELAGSAPIIVQNETRHELRFKQTGVSVVGVVPAGASYPYTWDEPARKQRMHLTLTGCGVRFSCSTVPNRVRRPLLGAVLGRKLFELCVASEGACTRIRVQEVAVAGNTSFLLRFLGWAASLCEQAIEPL